MIAATFWSLLLPALEKAEGGSLPVWAPAAIDFLLGGIFLWSADKLLPHFHPGLDMDVAEGINPDRKRRSMHLVLAITLDNIPKDWLLVSRSNPLPLTCRSRR